MQFAALAQFLFLSGGMRVSRILILLFLVQLCAGCAATCPSSRSAWIAHQGGILVDARQTRVNTAIARLSAGHPEWSLSGAVLGSNSVGAFTWPDRTIYITRGLIDRADDDMLAAAIAHEMGHLLSGGQLQWPAALKGHRANLEAESLADAYGLQLLRLGHVPGGAMPRMLRLARDSNPLGDNAREAMTRRIERLGAELSDASD